MKKKLPIFITVFILIAVCVLGALWLFTGTLKPESETKGVLLDKETGEKSAYSIEILKYGEIESDYVKRWIDKYREDGIGGDGKPVYFALYNDNQSAPMEMYFYMPEAKSVMGDVTLSNIRVNEWGAAAVLTIDTKDNISRTKDGADLILHIYVNSPENAKCRSVLPVINGDDKIPCGSTDFTKLK